MLVTVTVQLFPMLPLTSLVATEACSETVSWLAVCRRQQQALGMALREIWVQALQQASQALWETLG